MGEALSLVEIANVFMNRVTEQAAIGEFSVSRMLGHAIAHEIGHLLLGDNSHSPGGIMVAPWSKQDLWRMSKGKLLFTHQESYADTGRGKASQPLGSSRGRLN